MKKNACSNNFKRFLVFLGLGLFFLMLWLISELLKTRRQVEVLQTDVQNLLSFQIEQSQKPGRLNESLKGLIALFESKDNDVCEELKTVQKRLADGEEADAARIIAKIVESKMKAKAKVEDHSWFSKFKNASAITLNTLIDWGKSRGFFDEEEYALAQLMRTFRNDNSHLLNVENKVEFNEKMLRVHISIKILRKLVPNS